MLKPETLELITKITRHPTVICLEIVMIVAVTDSLMMQFLELTGFEFPHDQEVVLEPFLMSILAVPFVYFLIIYPFFKRESKARKEIVEAQTAAELANQEKLKIVSEQAATLKEAVALATDELKSSETRYALAAQGANDGLWDWDRMTNSVYYSPRWKMMLGYRVDEFPNSIRCWLNHTHPSDRDSLEKEFESLSQDKPSFSKKYRMKTSSNEYIWVHTRGMAIFDEDGRIVRLAGSQTDINDQKKAEDELLYNAYHDSLTGIANRTLFNDRLNQALLNAKRNKNEHFAVLFLDLDNFKKVNDTFGHSVGDALLKNITRKILGSLRGNDTVARLGGDEFAIILQNVKTANDVKKIADTLKKQVGLPITIKKHKIFPSVSIGIVFWDKSYKAIENLLRDADFALYRAKENGKNRFAIFDGEMRAQAASLFKKETQLRQALKKKQIHVFYQPIARVDTLKIEGFEALLRWNHPKFGWVSPIEFIQIAEESDLILDLGKFVLETAASDFVNWKKLFPDLQFVSVNVSARQLDNDRLIKQVNEVTHDTGIKPANLKLEVTETTVMKKPEVAQHVLEELHQMGVKIAIDDFGTGYSSLSTLHEFHFDSLKIDQSFTRDLESSPRRQELVTIINMMGKNLGLETIVEGVETREQLQMLKSIGCDYIQGYYLSRPVAHDDFKELLAAHTFEKKIRA